MTIVLTAAVSQKPRWLEGNPCHQPKIHIISTFASAVGGSEWRAIALYEELRHYCEVQLWSTAIPAPELLKQYPIRRIRQHWGRFPKTGTLIFMGIFSFPKRWVQLTLPSRIIVVYNTYTPEFFAPTLRRLSLRGLRTVEVVYASEMIKQSVNYPGIVEPSLIDINHFVPGPRSAQWEAGDRFKIGRLSRDEPEKHHPQDPELYGQLVEHGCEIQVMGGTCLAHACGDSPHIHLLPCSHEQSLAFLQNLDCFFYRTSEQLLEAFGRVVLEAMACGLPVVCHARGGYTEVIESGRNGFLFETNQEALEILLRLKRDRQLRQQIGQAARATVEAIYHPERRQQIINFYLGLSGQTSN